MTLRLVFLIVSLVLSANADILVLRNGTRVTGTWVGMDAGQIKFNVNDQARKYSRSDVVLVIFGTEVNVKPEKPSSPAKDHVTVGQTIEQVETNLGKPAQLVNVGAKKIYIYNEPPVKITFKDGKVFDIE